MVPESLGNLTVLTTLNLKGNQLTAVPQSLAGLLEGGLQLQLDGNPLDDPLAELAARGPAELATYLRSLHDAKPQYEAKLVLVGEGNVGKTSLVAALKGEKFVEGRPTSHGIEISPLTVRHPSVNTDMTVRAWDFGGQEVYRVSHQFFLTRRALYLVVWNARQGQEHDEVEGWLRRIRLRARPDAQTLVVATQCAERLPELDYPHLEQIFPGMLLSTSFEVDCSTGQGIGKHPWEPAAYDLDPPKEWFTRIAPYAVLVFRALQLIVPAAGAVTIASMPQAQEPVAQAYLQAMGTVLDDLPTTPQRPGPESGLTADSEQLTTAEGEALRALRAIIFEHDPLRAFGGLSRVQAPSGESGQLPLRRGTGHPPSLERQPARRPWRTAEIQL